MPGIRHWKQREADGEADRGKQIRLRSIAIEAVEVLKTTASERGRSRRDCLIFSLLIGCKEAFAGLVKSQDDTCLLGTNNMNMNIARNIRSNLGGLIKAYKPYNYAVSLGFNGIAALSEPKLLMNLLTLLPEQYSRINTRNVHAIQDYPRFVSTNSEKIVNGVNTNFIF
jgi:hypothetical protein